jgi:hypothetical protein
MASDMVPGIERAATSSLSPKGISIKHFYKRRQISAYIRVPITHSNPSEKRPMGHLYERRSWYRYVACMRNGNIPPN